MNETNNSTPKLFGLLIGVDCYLPNRLPAGSYYPSLRGCVRDVSMMEAFLKRKFSIAEKDLVKLTASNTGAEKPPEPREAWPTYENIVAAFKQLSEMAKPGDQVIVHYSGHGGRASTVFPQLKGESGLDEALVLTDIGNPAARYLRDLELAKLLSDMVAKDLIVAVILDSCHSGGMTRGVGTTDIAIRGINVVDTIQRPVESLVASHDDLVQTCRSLTEDNTRAASLGSGRLPEPKGYVLLAACRPSEFAYEYNFEGSERNGALTYWLLDSLEDVGSGLSYKLLHDRILPKVHSQFEAQTPLLQGEGDRQVFGSECVKATYSVPVMRVDQLNRRLLLQTGQVHAVRKGATFAIYARGSTDLTNETNRQALVEISEVGATDSWATIKKELGVSSIEQGASAVLIGAGSVKLIRKVGLVRREDLLSFVGQESALRAVGEAVKESGWVEVVCPGEQIDYQVALNNRGEYEIWDQSGHKMSNLRPPLESCESYAARKVAQRLVHLAKYHAIQHLNNFDAMSPLCRRLVVELLGKQREYDPSEKPAPTPFDPGSPNTVTVLDLKPGWGICQIYPSGPTDYFVPLEPNEKVDLPLKADLPPNYQHGADVLKVFGTVGAANFRWLELPDLDRPPRQSGERTTIISANPLEQLLVAVAAEKPATRELSWSASPSGEWVTAQVEVHIRRPSQGDG